MWARRLQTGLNALLTLHLYSVQLCTQKWFDTIKHVQLQLQANLIECSLQVNTSAWVWCASSEAICKESATPPPVAAGKAWGAGLALA